MPELNQDFYFGAILNDLAKKGNNRSEKGTLFENFCYQLLKKAPFFSDRVNEVWTWNEFPGNGGKHDIGIDLVVLTKDGDFWAVQCKFYDVNRHVSKADIDSFVSAASKEFDYEGKTYTFAVKYVFSTTYSVSGNADGLFTLFGPEDIKGCGIDWTHFDIDDIEGMKVAPKKTLKPHQIEALNDVLEGFKTHDRGKLIMACGTGKTFTSLKIVEKYINDNQIIKLSQ